MRLGIDLDGVCYDFVGALQKFAKTQGYGDLPYAESWDFFKNQWGWTTDEYLRVFGQGVLHRDIFWDGNPEPGCVEALTELAGLGHRIVVVTHRDHPDKYVSYQMRQATVDWLYRHRIPHDSLMFEGKKFGLGIDLLLDDAPHTIKAYHEAAEGIVVMDRPWNQDLGFDVLRAYSWGEFIDIVQEQEELEALLRDGKARREGLPA